MLETVELFQRGDLAQGRGGQAVLGDGNAHLLERDVLASVDVFGLINGAVGSIPDAQAFLVDRTLALHQ